MESLGRTMGAWGVVGIAALALLVLPALAVPASASPTPLAAGAPQQWAYGGEKWANVTIDLPNATYTSHAFFGWSVIFTATNTSATTVELEAQRAMAGSFYAQYCSPSCASPTTFGNLSISAWEKSAGFANLTTTGTVDVNGNATAAVALSDAASQSAANLSESFTFSTGSGNATHSTSASLDVAGASHAAIAFTPALGLVPLNVSTGEHWNSSAAFAASGSWMVSASYWHTSVLGGTVTGHPSASASVAANGTVAIAGYDAGTITLANNQTVPVILLSWNGPFDDEDGVILVPHDFDMFNGGSHVWDAESLGEQSVATSELDVHVDGFHHLHIDAAASEWGASDQSLSATETGTAQPAASGSGTLVQAQPESVAQAQQSQGCYVGGCPAATTHGLLGGALGAAVLVGLIAAVVVGAVALVAHRRATRARAGTPVPPGAAQGTPAPPAPPAGGPGGLPKQP